MAADGAAGDTQETSVETLRKEIESLKVKLDEERQKMNDVTRELWGSTCSGECVHWLFFRSGVPMTVSLGMAIMRNWVV